MAKSKMHCRHCGNEAYQVSSSKISADIFHQYFRCKDMINCGHTWRATLSYDHSLQPPLHIIDQLLIDRLSRLPAAQQMDLLEQAKLAS